MPLSKSLPPRKHAAGFTLPAVLVVTGALLILAVGILLVVGIERNTARSFVDRQRADLAVRAGLEDINGIFKQEAANDDFLIIQAIEPPAANSPAPVKDLVPYLYLARGSGGEASLNYRYLPLFSSATSPASTGGAGNVGLKAPVPSGLVGTNTKDLSLLPWYEPAKVAWIEIPDQTNRIVSRYAYWVEDLQSRVDAGTAGNTLDAGTHKRFGWKQGDASKQLGQDKSPMFPAPGLNPAESKPEKDGRDAEPPLNQVALYALDPVSGAKDTSDLDKKIIDGRKILISPDSVLAAVVLTTAEIALPLTRDKGHLNNPLARAVEENLVAAVQPYDEQPLVPFAKGIAAAVTGKPKLNLNSLLAKPGATAVDEMAAWIKQGLPDFDLEKRKGGFPDNYLKTLAANAIDYADAYSDGTVSPATSGPEAYRGLDAYPLMSEIILHFKYLGVSESNGRMRLDWQMILFVELWNHTNQEVNGSFRVSYENGFRPPAIGAGVTGDRFDDPLLLDDLLQTKHSLTKIGARYWTEPRTIMLLPNQYQFYKATTVNYFMDVGSLKTTLQNQFNIYEDLGASGISLKWNDREVDRNDKLVRGNNDTKKPKFDYFTSIKEQAGVANIPGHSYGPYNKVNDYKNNMGDSRQAHYLRGAAYPLSDNAYPGNVSPNRRNIRYITIYNDKNEPITKPSVYGRVQPSEWPDGGHDTEVKLWQFEKEEDYDPSNPAIYPEVTNAREGEAPSFISNRGRFYSATELGRIHDPVMFMPTFDNDNDTKSIRTGKMPSSRISWPSVEAGAPADIYYGGGNTLRIGRPEHPKFDQPAKHAPADMPGTHAARLLDLFHAGKSRSEQEVDREGPLVRIEGHVNLNTATPDAIRAMVGGLMVADPRLVERKSLNHSTSTMAPPVATTPLAVSAPTKTKEGDVVAEAIVRGRPFASSSEIASILNDQGKLVFGNRDILPKGNATQWSDAAAEEAFARVYESSTVRSRNFRVWVIGQAVSPTTPANPAPEVLAEVRKAFTVFANPGVRNSNGTIDPTKLQVTILSENDF